MKTIQKIRINHFKGLTPQLEEGETIIAKMKRVMDENEPITDGAPPIYTPKESGVVDAYNIRADRWQIAMNAMDRVNSYKASEYLKNSENKPTEEETKPTTKPTVNEETHQE